MAYVIIEGPHSLEPGGLLQLLFLNGHTGVVRETPVSEREAKNLRQQWNGGAWDGGDLWDWAELGWAYMPTRSYDSLLLWWAPGSERVSAPPCRRLTM